MPVVLKAELFQRTGAFKIRGVLNKLAALSAEERERGVISVSAGNHAQAVALGAALEGLDALLVTWRGASEQKIAATRAYGAEVDQTAAGPSEAFDRLHELIEESGRTLIHPFDDPLIIAGQGTVALELAEDAPGVDIVLAPVGGGGLVAGTATALPDVRVIAVEPELAPAMHDALAAGESVAVQPHSIADGCNAPFAGPMCVEIAQARGMESVLVTEAEIEAGMRFLYERAKLACEGAGAVAVAALLAGKVPLEGAKHVGIIVSGGNIDAQVAAAILFRR